MTIMQNRNNRRLGFTLIELMIVIAVLAVMAAVLTPGYMKARAQRQFTACKSNVKKIGTACEMFAIEHKGGYPEQLACLTMGPHGGYLEEIPACPAAGYDTYTASYTVAVNPDCFTVRCGGANHVALNIPVDYPLYYSGAGLVCTGEPGEAVASADVGNDSVSGDNEGGGFISGGGGDDGVGYTYGEEQQRMAEQEQRDLLVMRNIDEIRQIDGNLKALYATSTRSAGVGWCKKAAVDYSGYNAYKSDCESRHPELFAGNWTSEDNRGGLNVSLFSDEVKNQLGY